MLWIILLGVVTGMRTMTAVTVLCWAAWLGALPQTGWESFVGSPVTVAIFTLLALGEYVVDVLPQTPSRKDAPLLVSRLVFGSFAGLLGWHALMEPIAGGILIGMIGAWIGTYGGYRLRVAMARVLHHDLPAGLIESACALLFALAAAHMLHEALVRPPVAMLLGTSTHIFG